MAHRQNDTSACVLLLNRPSNAGFFYAKVRLWVQRSFIMSNIGGIYKFICFKFLYTVLCTAACLNEWEESQICSFKGHRDVKTAFVELLV